MNRTGYGSKPRIGTLVVLRRYKEEASGVEYQPKGTGRQNLRRWGRTRREGARHLV